MRWLLKVFIQKGNTLFYPVEFKVPSLVAQLANKSATNQIDGFGRAQMIASMA
jgi:hypothetical protein